MLKQVTSHPGFWKSVLALAIAFILLFTLVKGIIEGFNFSFVMENPLLYVGGIIAAGFVYGFIVSFGKFRSKIKNQ